MLGYTVNEIPPYSSFWKNFIHPGDRQAAFEANLDCIENRCDHFEVEFRMQAKNGDWRWILAQGKAVTRDQQGRATRMVGTHTDITVRKQAEAVLREKEEYYRMLTNQIQAAVIVHGPDTRIISCNQKAQELMGLTEEQMLARTSADPDWKLLNAQGEAASPENYPVNKVISSQKPLKNFVAGILQPGRQDIVWVLVNAQPVFDGDFNIKQVIVTFIDITERKNAEEALIRSEQQKNLILNSTTEMVTYYDTELTVIWSNRAAAESVGSRPEDLVGRLLRNLA